MQLRTLYSTCIFTTELYFADWRVSSNDFVGTKFQLQLGQITVFLAMVIVLGHYYLSS